MEHQTPCFVFDRHPLIQAREQEFNREMSLRWQFIQQKKDKPLPRPILPRMNSSQRPQRPDTYRRATHTIQSIVTRLKELYKDGKLESRGGASCQMDLARELCERWRFMHHQDTRPLRRLVARFAHECTALEEVDYMKELITEARYEWFHNQDEKAKHALKQAQESFDTANVETTREHQVVSREFRTWRAKQGMGNVYVEGTGNVNTDPGWCAWYRHEQRLLKAEMVLDNLNKGQTWVFCDILAAMTNGLIDKGEM
ncbi:hypothetical protein ACHAPT_010878 [Fusarium lateritium]